VIPAYKKAGASAVPGRIEDADSGGFTAIASTGDVDRDGERLLPGAFDPLPDSIPVHLDHTLAASTVVARAVPYYRGEQLLSTRRSGSSPAAQQVRDNVKEGRIDSVSVVFLGKTWEDRDGVRCLVEGELLACDLVTVPSNRSARVLAMRSVDMSRLSVRQLAQAEITDATLVLARAEILEAKAFLGLPSTRGRGTAATNVRTFLGSL